jgi:hypothetical protein
MHGLEADSQTFQIIGAAMEVHRQMHRGLFESFYCDALDEAQLLNYLAMTKLHRGLLLNFGTKSLEYKRRVL